MVESRRSTNVLRVHVHEKCYYEPLTVIFREKYHISFKDVAFIEFLHWERGVYSRVEFIKGRR